MHSHETRWYAVILPGPQLLSQPLGVTKLYCLVTEEHCPEFIRRGALRLDS